VSEPAEILSDDERALANVLGALALVVSDELGRAVTHAVSESRGGSVTDAAALSALAEFLGGSTVDRVHRVLGLTPSGAVRLVDRLEAAGLVTRAPGPDRRSRAIRLTARGRDRALAVGGARWAYLSRLTAGLSPDEVTTLRDLMGRVMGNVVDAKESGAWTCRLCDLSACRRAEGECPAVNAAQERFGQERFGRAGGEVPADAGSIS
jgi:DNA-binding MarR family transcriptional regulator